jgi:hypothetical protein
VTIHIVSRPSPAARFAAALAAFWNTIMSPQATGMWSAQLPFFARDVEFERHLESRR